ncbi:MAG: hypothetical protein KAU01_08440 [Candidatus Cloacimonetes bacterium]|nr:hypothetical protein [Candidatus Cloacimonadota bacterium]
MKDLENKLNSMKIPGIEDDPFEDKLRNKLLNKYYKQPNNYRIKFRYAAAFVCLLLIFGCSTILNPDIAVKLNKFAFPGRIFIDENGEEISLKEKLTYTSIYNPKLVEKIDPEEYEEDKAYIIRKYTSPKEGIIMIVSEFNQRSEKKEREISF